MNALVLALVAGLSAGNFCSVSGQVLDGTGEPIAGATVFLEQGIDGPIYQTRTTLDGRYRFDEVLPGVVGVIARGGEFSWNGRSVSLGLGQSVSNIDIELRRSGSVSGTVIAGKKRPVSGARVTRVALLSATPVSIPYAKLRNAGVREPVTDSSGAFTVSDLPSNTDVVLKISHRDFAQARVDGVRVGNRSVDVTMYQGVLLTGRVVASRTARPVAQASVFIRNANPPRDTAIARSDQQGDFALRILPGQYVYRAGGERFGSGAWQPLTLTGQHPLHELTVSVAGTARITGKVMDAKTGEPIENARVVLESGGLPAALARTGPSGRYALNAVAGEGVVRIDEAPGYLPPPAGGTRFTAGEGTEIELPSFWLASIPEYRLRIVDTGDRPAAGAVVRLVRPAQIGWRIANTTGEASLRFLSLPPDGRVMGIAEHPALSEAAVFSIARANADDAVVQLLPTATISGTVLGDNERGLEGAVVEGRFLDESAGDPVLLWRTVTDPNGRFRIAGVPAQVPQVLVGYTVNETLALGEQSAPLTVIAQAGEAKDAGTLSVPGREKGRSLLGKRLSWDRYPMLCEARDPIPDETVGPAVITFCEPDEAHTIVDSLATATDSLPDSLVLIVGVDGDYACEGGAVQVVSGRRPGTAATYVLDAGGRVVFEGFGIPPIDALRTL